MSDSQILPVNKPVGLSTFDLIRRYKREHNYNGKIGHAGTLDVFAEGLVLLLLGSATKQFAEFQTLPKTYIAHVRLGASSNTLDVEGVINNQKDPVIPKREAIETVLPDFIGVYDQAVPAFSATKQAGQPAYKLARAGKEVIAKSKPVTIHQLRLLAYKYPLITLEATVGSGTYIRQLTVDIFHKLQLESFLFGLKRTAIGEHALHGII